MQKNLANYLTTTEEQEIVEAIRLAKKNTSGEIRVHIENTFKDTIENRALEVFSILKMNHTKLRNGVLIYIAVKDKLFTIYGDQGIHNFVDSSFWDTTKNKIEIQFKQGNFKQGLIDGVLHIGKQLKKYFPIQDNDYNELSNAISKD